jgi:uncharacterized membrane protein
MSTNPGQGQNPDPANTYGGYSGYTPRNSADDPYSAHRPGPDPAQTTGNTQANDPTYVYGQQGQKQQYSTGQQQQGTYQPPDSVLSKSRGSEGAYDATTLGMEARLEALLSYLFGWFTGIIFFFLERKNRYVRFHAAQSIVLFGPAFIVYVLAQFLIKITAGIFLLSSLFATVFGCLSFALIVVFGLLWIFLMVQAYRGVRVRLPFVGNYADGLLRRFSRRGSI